VRLIDRLEHGCFLILDTRRGDLGVKELFRLTVQPDQPFLVALFEQPKPGALALVTVIAALDADNGADAPESVPHDSDDGPVAQSLDVHDLLVPPPCFAGTLAFRVIGIESSSKRIWSASIIGVMPTWRLNFGPLTNIAGFSGTTCLMTSQLNRPRSAARCCFMDGAVSALASI